MRTAVAGARSAGRAAGWVLLALGCPLGSAFGQGDVADTVPPATVVETSHTFRSGPVSLEGTLARPRSGGRIPIAVIVAGSGPTDRNGNAAAGIRPNTYAQLAWRLAERGVASLRYDKRVLPTARGPVDVATLAFDDFAGDLAAAVRSVGSDARFAQVVVAGHSEGGALAIRAVTNGLELSGIALVATAGRPLGPILREQLARQVDAATLARFDTAMALYLAGENPGDVPAALMPLFLPVNRRYTQTVAQFDPVAELRATALPLLILQGAADLQVTVADAEALHRARPDARLVVLPETNHVLKGVADTTLMGQLSTYQNPTIPIVGSVVDELVSWIGSLR